MLKFVNWAQGIVTLRPDAASHIADVAWVFKAHIVLGLTLFVVFPFSRLVHIWSGFATVGYLTRAYQIVRSRG
jgi:nitrate reductase gamma subunit